MIYDLLYERNPENSTYLEKYMLAKKLRKDFYMLNLVSAFFFVLIL